MRKPFLTAAAVALLGASAAAQTPQEFELDKVKKAVVTGIFAGLEKQLLEIGPLAPAAGVMNAPFTADAVTEFSQILGDGNRIERTFTSSIARDSKGRTRREQEVAMLGALAPLQAHEPRLVIVGDPATGKAFTLDARRRTATQSLVGQIKGKAVARAGGITGHDATTLTIDQGAPTTITTTRLGRRQFEGVSADGTRTTLTIPAGGVGNLQPIEIVTERWFSSDLQMELMISRKDPRSGDTVYRLSNIVRAEPAADLFEVPAGYTVLPMSKKPALAAKSRKVEQAPRRK